MSAPPPVSARTPRAASQYRWTREKALGFITALAVHGSVAAAARAVGMSRNSAYRLRARLGQGYAKAWDDAQAIAARQRLNRGAR
ncbi:MAG: LysR family transcriptional regulator [Novosphingobium sp.]